MKNLLANIKNYSELNLNISLGNKNGPSKLFTFLNISEKLKKAFKEEIELREGLKIILNDYKLRRKAKINFTIDAAPLEFAFCVSGKAKSKVESKGQIYETELKSGMFALFHFPFSKGSIEIDGAENVRILSIHIAPNYLNSFISDDFINLPVEIDNIIQGNGNQTFILTGQMSPMMNLNIQQIYETRIKGTPGKMFLEAKALELMTFLLNEISSENSNINNIQLNDYEIEMLHKVKEKLSEDISNPPSIVELTRISGMSHTKLYKSFKYLFNTTPFAYLRNLRLDYSRMLLAESKLSVTQITYEAGWSNPSHFTREFTKAYNITPKQYRKEQIKYKSK